MRCCCFEFVSACDTGVEIMLCVASQQSPMTPILQQYNATIRWTYSNELFDTAIVLQSPPGNNQVSPAIWPLAYQTLEHWRAMHKTMPKLLRAFPFPPKRSKTTIVSRETQDRARCNAPPPKLLISPGAVYQCLTGTYVACNMRTKEKGVAMKKAQQRDDKKSE
jgi:hypothetical protein